MYDKTTKLHFLSFLDMILTFILLKIVRTCIALSGRPKDPVIRAINNSIATVSYDKEAFNIKRSVVEVKLIEFIQGVSGKTLGVAGKNIDQVRRKVFPFTYIL